MWHIILFSSKEALIPAEVHILPQFNHGKITMHHRNSVSIIKYQFQIVIGIIHIKLEEN
jgi:hypothetical protein